VPNNLTRIEARERARLLSVSGYRVDLDLSSGDTTFGSATTVSFSCTEPGAATFIELTAPSVEQVTLNGRQVDLAAFDGNRIALAGLAADNELTVVASCAYSSSGEGLHWFTDPADGGVYLHSDLETYDAHRIYACFDQPDLKATFEFTVIAPQAWLVVSNTAPDVSGEPAGPGRARWHFPPGPPMSSYFTAIVAGTYHRVTSSHDGIPLGIYCRQSLASYLDSGEIFEVTGQGFDYFHRAFGVRYPFGKYDQLFVPEYKSGAMENAGCVTFLEAYLFRSRVTDSEHESRADTILHEMAHMWFGDLVTMRWWDDLWLNESFASWASAAAQSEATRWPQAWTTFAQVYKTWAYRQDQLPTTHPIAADIGDIAAVEVNFDGITYAKGAAVLKQLVAYVGRGNFLAGVRNYFAAHAFGNASLADLLAALSDSSGRDLSEWSKLWLETAGVNTLRPDFTVAQDGTFASFSVLQEAAADHPVLRPHRMAIGLYDLTDGKLTRRHRAELDVAGERTEVTELVGMPAADLVLVNDDDLSYAKIRLDRRSLDTLIEAAAGFTESLPAALCWAAAWDMCRDGELAARDYMRFVLSGMDKISEIFMLQSVLGQADMAVRRYADPAWRAEGLATVAAAYRERMLAAEPGSDRQLAFAQAFAGVATGAADLALVAALLDGSRVLDGLVVDTELRWLLLDRLVTGGQAGPMQIAAELDRDRTDAGERHAASCRAAIPDPAAKAAAWQQIMAGLPNATYRAVLRGFTGPDNEELLVPYADAYFDAVGRIWQEWTPDMAVHFAQYAYPVTVVSQQAIDKAGEYIARTDPPPSLRRLLVEGKDATARALRCRAADALAAGSPHSAG
jgi:aminopeptidase N